MTPDSPKTIAGEIVARLQQASFAAFWVGGCVRDFLLGRAPQDFDIATDAR
ncbi:MAG: CCA tRNA nucleotidyltransferase, partial [Verrucomicrobiota bacterium]